MANLELYSMGFEGENLKEDQRQNLWVVNFPDFPNFDLYIQDSTLPLFTMSFEKLPNMDLITPKSKDDYKTFSVTYRETTDFQGLRYHISWMQNLWDFNKRVVKKTYHTSKKNIILKFLSLNNQLGPPDENGIATMISKLYQTSEFTLWGVQLISIDDVSLGSDSGDPLTFTVNYEIQNIGTDFSRKEL